VRPLRWRGTQLVRRGDGVDNLCNLWQSAETATDASTYGNWTKVDGQLRP